MYIKYQQNAYKTYENNKMAGGCPELIILPENPCSRSPVNSRVTSRIVCRVSHDNDTPIPTFQIIPVEATHPTDIFSALYYRTFFQVPVTQYRY